ncbi:MAG: orotate phosphoribosyltransferase [Bacteroidota bacterium]
MSNIYNIQKARQIATRLLEIEAVKLSLENPFEWSSGWLSPIYCDNRLSLSYPNVRNIIKSALKDLIKNKFPQTEAIAGVATAGIPMGILIANELNLPFLYVRSSPKKHGLENLVEGKIVEGQKIAVIEDLISTGGSSISAIKALKKEGCQIVGLGAIFTYDFDIADKAFQDENTEFYCLSDYNILLEEALQEGYIKEDNIENLKSWRDNPASWTKK